MKTTILSTCVAVCLFSIFSIGQTNLELISNFTINDAQLNDIWGYAAPDGKEYALVCGEFGIHIIDVSEPGSPKLVDSVGDSQNPRWLDVKTWNNFAYAVTQSTYGMMVIDLSNLPNPVEFDYWKNEDDPDNIFSWAHNIWIDEFGYGYLAINNLVSHGMAILDFNENPWNPAYIGSTSFGSAHDVFVENNIMYAAEGSNLTVSISDVTDKNSPALLSTLEIPGGYAHSVWATAEGETLFAADEKPYSPISSFDISDLDDIKLLDVFTMPRRDGIQSIPHNLYEKDGYLIVSHYVDGILILDAHKPDNLVLVGQYDTSNKCEGYNGVFGVYPFLPSGLIIASDRSNGLFVFQPNYQRACYLEGTITDAITGMPIIGASIEILSDDINDGESDVLGQFKTGQLSSGTFDVLIKKNGYFDKVVSTELKRAETTELEVEMNSLAYPIAIKVIDKSKNLSIPFASIMIEQADSNAYFITDQNGYLEIPFTLQGDYLIHAGKWGWNQNSSAGQGLSSDGVLTIELEKGYADNFVFDLGWKVYGEVDDGEWERGIPNDLPSTPCRVKTPSFDDENDEGNYCFATGLNANYYVHDWGTVSYFFNEVKNGNTWIVSPKMELSKEYVRPQLSYSTWFLTGSRLVQVINEDSVLVYDTIPPNDSLNIFIDNGKEKILLESIASSHEWEHSQFFELKEIIELTNEMSIIVQTSDTEENPNLVEAAFDNLKIVEGLSDDDLFYSDNNINWKFYPNPFSNHFSIEYIIDIDFESAKLHCFNAVGIEIEQLKLTKKIGKIDMLPEWPNGMYFLNFKVDGKTSETFKVVKQN